MAARDRLPLTQIADAARDLSDAVAEDTDKDALDDVRGVAVALSATAMKRPPRRRTTCGVPSPRRSD
jgi:hypothetical protein